MMTTVTLELPPDMGAELSERAVWRGQAITEYSLTLAEADWHGKSELSEAEREEEIAVIQQGLEELHAGNKGILLEEYRTAVIRHPLWRPLPAGHRRGSGSAGRIHGRGSCS